MRLRGILPFVLAVVLAVSSLCGVQAKTWTIAERQDQLMKDINSGQKAKELTAKEAKKLRKDLAAVARKKKDMTTKTDGKLTDEDKNQLEADLNDISARILKLKLEKRVQK